MTGGALVGLVLLRRRAKPGLGPLPGIVGSLTVFFSLPALTNYGLDVPWPWLWILLPLGIDPWFVLLVRRSK